jgi:hypothetical protein
MKLTSKFIIPPYLNLPFKVEDFLRQLCESLRRNHEDLYYDLRPGSIAIQDQDATPSVKNGHLKLFYTANTGATTITDFDEAMEGQIITVLITDAVTNIADAGNFQLSAAFNPNANDTITLFYKSGIWYEITRSAN